MEQKKRIYKHRPYKSIATLTKVSDEQKEKVKELYLQGNSQTKIESSLGMTRKTIRTILKQLGIDRDKSSQWRLRYGSSLKENVFDNLTPEALYWIGFLYADGHVGINDQTHKSFNVELSIDTKDTEHMKKYKLFLGCNKDLKFPKNKNVCTLKIYSKVIHSRLTELGFTHDKSYTAKPDILFKDSADFWRGVVDGDGCLSYMNEYPFLHLCGTYDTTKEFVEFLRRRGLVTKAEPRKTKGKALYQFSVCAIKAKKAARILYWECDTYLDRKYKIYKDWMELPVSYKEHLEQWREKKAYIKEQEDRYNEQETLINN